MKRYHKEVSFPINSNELLERYFSSFENMRYTQHAKRATIKDRYGIIPVVKKHELKSAYCFELVVESGRIIKAVFRVAGTEYDYCYSVSCEGAIVTCWANDKNDSHATLDSTLYASV